MGKKIYDTDEERRAAKKRNSQNFKERHRNDLEKKKRYAEKSKEWYDRQSEDKKNELALNALKNRKIRHKKDPRSGMFHDAKKRAKKRSIDFTIVLNDLIVPEFCPVLGIPLQVGEGKQLENSPSIDRVDPNIGYVANNIRVISYRANTIKSNASIQELEKIILYMKEHLWHGMELAKKQESE